MIIFSNANYGGCGVVCCVYDSVVHVCHNDVIRAMAYVTDTANMAVTCTVILFTLS